MTDYTKLHMYIEKSRFNTNRYIYYRDADNIKHAFNNANDFSLGLFRYDIQYFSNVENAIRFVRTILKNKRRITVIKQQASLVQ